MPDNEPTEVGDHNVDQSLLALAGILFAGRNATDTLAEVAALAQRTIPGCDAASVTSIKGGRPETTVMTDRLAEVVDQYQYDDDRGPCLEAIRVGQRVQVDSYTEDTRWPQFGQHAIEHGIHSSLSLPLVAMDEPVGALNLYSRQVAGFAAADPDGEAFARQAAITLANARAYLAATELAQQLSVALEHRDVIGQAKGILMARQGISSEEAFDVLRRASQRRNRKLYELAIELVAGNQPPRTGQP